MSTLKIDTNQALFAFSSTGQVFKRTGREGSPVPGRAEANNFNSAQSDSFTINPVARSISVADNTIEVIGRHIERMKTQLESIVKNYPPFPAGSSERAQYLRSFIGLRMEIEQLTVPPDENAGRLIADIKKINLPELTVTSTDKDIAAAIDGLDAASETLNYRRAGLGADIAATPAYGI